MNEIAERNDEALAAIEEVLRRYPDVFGPKCWCADEPCEGDCGAPVPSTVGLTGWVVVTEFSDLDPEGYTHTRWRCGRNTSPNLGLGMITRASRRI